MTSWTPINKNSSSFANINKSASGGGSITNTIGSPMGLLLVLTYPATVVTVSSSGWTNINKS